MVSSERFSGGPSDKDGARSLFLGRRFSLDPGSFSNVRDAARLRKSVVRFSKYTEHVKLSRVTAEVASLYPFRVSL
jgi:hypothetical protein